MKDGYIYAFFERLDAIVRTRVFRERNPRSGLLSADFQSLDRGVRNLNSLHRYGTNFEVRNFIINKSHRFLLDSKKEQIIFKDPQDACLKTFRKIILFLL